MSRSGYEGLLEMLVKFSLLSASYTSVLNLTLLDGTVVISTLF